MYFSHAFVQERRHNVCGGILSRWKRSAPNATWKREFVAILCLGVLGWVKQTKTKQSLDTHLLLHIYTLQVIHLFMQGLELLIQL